MAWPKCSASATDQSLKETDKVAQGEISIDRSKIIIRELATEEPALHVTPKSAETSESRKLERPLDL